jgi:hypothetical protein
MARTITFFVLVFLAYCGTVASHPNCEQAPESWTQHCNNCNPDPVTLEHVACSFAVLGGTGVTSVGDTHIVGNVGSSPADIISGFHEDEREHGHIAIIGSIHAGTQKAAESQIEMAKMVVDVAGRVDCVENLGVDVELGNRVLGRGVYTADNSFQLGTSEKFENATESVAITLDGKNDASAVFIFRAPTTLTAASSATILLINEAQASNVFWILGTSATIGSRAHIVGTVICGSDITSGNLVSIHGRLFSLGAINLDSNFVKSRE